MSSAYAPIDGAKLSAKLADLPKARERLGGDPTAWRVREVGDGNLNLVFIVEGPAGGVCVKQALPYVRAGGESWPMPLERAFFENSYYTVVAPYLGGLSVSGGSMIQYVNVERLLPDDVRERLLTR